MKASPQTIRRSYSACVQEGVCRLCCAVLWLFIAVGRADGALQTLADVRELPRGPASVWHWKGAYWMIVDAWKLGLRIYRSEDGLSNWTYTTEILLAPGKRALDSQRWTD